MTDASISKGAFIRAMEPIRGRRFLAFRRNNNLGKRLLGFRPHRFYAELNVDSLGYCTLMAYKNPASSHRDADGDEELVLEQYRFVGPNLALELLHRLPQDIAMMSSTNLTDDDNHYTNCVQIRGGGDFKRYKARSLLAMEGDLYLVANDSGLVSLLKLALMALARASAPDGQCMFGNVFDRPASVALTPPQNTASPATPSSSASSSSFHKTTFRLGRLEQVQFARTVAVLVSFVPLSASQPSLSSLLKHKTSPQEAWTLVQKPPSSELAASSNNEAEEQQRQQLACAALHLLVHLVASFGKTGTPSPISFPCFQLFLAQANRLQEQQQQQSATGSSKFIESEELSQVCGQLLQDLACDPAVALVREITRVIKEWNASATTSMMVMEEWAELLGPGLVESYARREHLEPVVWLLGSLAYPRYRDKVFGKFNRNSRTPPPVPGASLRLSQQQQQVKPSPMRAVAAAAAAAVQDVPASPRTPSPVPATAPPPTPPVVVMAPTTPTTPTTPAFLSSSNEVLLQDDRDAVERLVKYLRQRIQQEDDSSSPLHALFTHELRAAEHELHTRGGPHIQAMLGQLNTTEDKTATTQRRSSSSSSDGTSEEEDEYTPPPTSSHRRSTVTSSDADSSASASASSDAFTRRVLELWAEARQEALQGTRSELDESAVMLRHTLQEVRELATNIGQQQQQHHHHAQQQRQTTMALVSMLEDNLVLRLRLITNSGGEPQTASTMKRT